MHSIHQTSNDTWAVVFELPPATSGLRNTRTVARFSNPIDAGNCCSWLNGGKEPDAHVIRILLQGTRE